MVVLLLVSIRVVLGAKLFKNKPVELVFIFIKDPGKSDLKTNSLFVILLKNTYDCIPMEVAN